LGLGNGLCLGGHLGSPLIYFVRYFLISYTYYSSLSDTCQGFSGHFRPVFMILSDIR